MSVAEVQEVGVQVVVGSAAVASVAVGLVAAVMERVGLEMARVGEVETAVAERATGDLVGEGAEGGGSEAEHQVLAAC